MDNIPCPLCAGERFHLVYAHRNDVCLAPEVEVRTVVCVGCGFVFHNPRPSLEDLRALYQDYGGTRKFAPNEDYVLRKDYDAERKLDWLTNVAAPFYPGRALDIGAAAGNFLRALAARDWTVVGLEPTIAYAEHARAAYGLDVRTAMIEDADFSPSSFSLITMGEVLEHLPDPLAKLRTIRTWLRDDGILYIDVPNVARPVKSDLDYYFRGEHINHFSPTTLRLALEATGFRVVAHKDHFYQYVACRKAPPRAVQWAREGEPVGVVLARIRRRHVRLVPGLAKKAVKNVVLRTLGYRRGLRVVGRIARALDRKV